MILFKIRWCLIYVHLIAFSIIGCTVSRQCIDCGAVLYKKRILNGNTNEFVKMQLDADRRLWYKDSVVIQESLTLELWEQNGKDTGKILVNHYIYFNLKDMSVYEFASFSDTATLLKKYKVTDTTNLAGGWSFHRKGMRLFSDSITYLTDTIIDKIKYGRVISQNTLIGLEGEFTYINVGYLRCDKKQTIFHIDKTFDENNSCPLVRFEFIIRPKQPWVRHEIDFVSEELSRKELKVFKAWERYANSNPLSN